MSDMFQSITISGMEFDTYNNTKRIEQILFFLFSANINPFWIYKIIIPGYFNTPPNTIILKLISPFVKNKVKQNLIKFYQTC